MSVNFGQTVEANSAKEFTYWLEVAQPAAISRAAGGFGAAYYWFHAQPVLKTCRTHHMFSFASHRSPKQPQSPEQLADLILQRLPAQTGSGPPPEAVSNDLGCGAACGCAVSHELHCSSLAWLLCQLSQVG